MEVSIVGGGIGIPCSFPGRGNKATTAFLCNNLEKNMRQGCPKGLSSSTCPATPFSRGRGGAEGLSLVGSVLTFEKEIFTK